MPCKPGERPPPLSTHQENSRLGTNERLQGRRVQLRDQQPIERLAAMGLSRYFSWVPVTPVILWRSLGPCR